MIAIAVIDVNLIIVTALVRWVQSRCMPPAGRGRYLADPRSATAPGLPFATQQVQEAYTKINGRLALASADDRWELAVYGRNLTDEVTYTATLDAPVSAGVMAAWVEVPRVVGVQARYNF